VDWKPPTGGVVDQYLVYRMRTDDLTPKVRLRDCRNGHPPRAHRRSCGGSAELPNIAFSYTVAAQFADDRIPRRSVSHGIAAGEHHRCQRRAGERPAVATNEDPPNPFGVATDVDRQRSLAIVTGPSHGVLSGPLRT
jgi:hypothetical protein